MKSYLEVTWLLSAVLQMVTLDAGAHLLHLSVNRKKLLLISTAAVIVSERLSIFFNGAFLWMHLCVSLVLCPYRFMVGLESLFLYLSSLYLLQMSGFVQMQRFFVHVDASSWTGVCLCLGFCLGLHVLVQFLMKAELKAELAVPVVISTALQSIECIGYLDTGNLAEHLGLPIVFVKQPFSCSFSVEVNSIAGTSKLPAETAVLYLNGKSYDVIAANSSDLQVDCLLHSSMR